MPGVINAQRLEFSADFYFIYIKCVYIILFVIFIDGFIVIAVDIIELWY